MYKVLKRLIDLCISTIVLLLTAPISIVVLILLFWANNGKVFFIQARPGLNGRIFNIIKFKTMNDRTSADGKLLSDAERLTCVGQLLRKTSIDELPQLINVIKGDMSLIGPRPLLVEYLPLYNSTQKKRHDVRPGITGWAQVNGRNAISWDMKFQYDVWYVDNLSWALDMKILFLTVKKVFKLEGISSGVSVTMEKFLGNQQ